MARDDLHKPLLLAAGNFTPLSRTPWAGEAIGRQFKETILPSALGQKIGESWEFSCDPDFPSRLKSRSQSLFSLLEDSPQSFLSENETACEILVKILNAQAPLSLQVHPRDDDPTLKSHECGKPESWLVLDAEPGAGLYLGFSKELSQKELKRAIQEGEDLSPWLHFVPVKANDYFEILPGVCHAIGSGVTLLEPQRVLFGKSGKTFRLWDWNRKYNASGEVDLQTGSARELHIEASCRLIDFKKQVGENFVNTLRQRVAWDTYKAGIKFLSFEANPYYQVQRCSFQEQSQMRLDLKGGYAVCLLLAGHLEFCYPDSESVTMQKGESAFLPLGSFPVLIKTLKAADCVFVYSKSAQYTWQ